MHFNTPIAHLSIIILYIYLPTCSLFDSMHMLNFTLSPEGVVRIHDAVLCLAKFSELVSLEARQDTVRGVEHRVGSHH